jgi:hypothetical protein
VYSSANIVRPIKSRRMKAAGIGEMRTAYKLSVENPQGKKGNT